VAEPSSPSPPIAQLSVPPGGRADKPVGKQRQASPGKSPVESPGRRQRLAAKLLRDKTNALFRHFPAALSGDEEAIHQLRVSGRRLRIAIRLLAPKPDGHRASRAQRLLQQLTQIAGGGRDLDVLLSIYSKRLEELPSRSWEQNRFRHRLADTRRRARARMVSALLDMEISQLRSDLATLAARSGPDLLVVGERFRALGEHEGELLEKDFNTLGAVLDITALHDMRRRARRLRYGIEIVDLLFGPDAGTTKPWKILQELIGVLHDHHVLAEWFQGQATADETRGNTSLAAAGTAEAAWAHSAMQKLHDEFLSANPSALIARGLSALRRSPEVQS
jgi:CHAD domain-containing protein